MDHVFISYSHKDKDRDYAHRLADYLKANHFDVWIDDQIVYGDDWWQVVVQAIRSCKAFIVIITPDSEQSDWVQRELTLAINNKKPTFPLWLAGDEPLKSDKWAILVRIQYADMRGGKLPEPELLERLAKSAPRKKTTGQDVAAVPQQQAAKRAKRPVDLRLAIPIFVLAVSVILIGISSLWGALRNFTNQDNGSTSPTVTFTRTVENTPQQVVLAPSNTPTSTDTPAPTSTLTPTRHPTSPFTSTPDFAATTAQIALVTQSAGTATKETISSGMTQAAVAQSIATSYAAATRDTINLRATQALQATGTAAAHAATQNASDRIMTQIAQSTAYAISAAATQSMINRTATQAAWEKLTALAPSSTPRVPTATRTPKTVSTNQTGSAKVTVNVQSANLRSGPGTNYDVVGNANQGEQFPIIAQAYSNSWYLITRPDNRLAWIAASIVSPSDAQIEAAATIPPSPIFVAQPTSAPTASGGSGSPPYPVGYTFQEPQSTNPDTGWTCGGNIGKSTVTDTWFFNDPAGTASEWYVKVQTPCISKDGTSFYYVYSTNQSSMALFPR